MEMREELSDAVMFWLRGEVWERSPQMQGRQNCIPRYRELVEALVCERVCELLF